MNNVEPTQGKLLVASPRLLDPNFYRTVVLIVEHDDDGTLGLILNRPTDAPVKEHLPDWEGHSTEPEVVFIGGPVQPDVGVGLAATDKEGSLSGAQLIDIAAGPEDRDSGVRVFAGYAGWGPNQLHDEIGEGGWLVVDAEPTDIFNANPEALWSEVLKRQEGSTAWLANFPQDPRLN